MAERLQVLFAALGVTESHGAAACPFCAGRWRLVVSLRDLDGCPHQVNAAIGCESCRTIGPEVESASYEPTDALVARAVEAWNRRSAA